MILDVLVASPGNRSTELWTRIETIWKQHEFYTFFFFSSVLSPRNPVYVDKSSYMLGGTVPIQKYSTASRYLYPKFFPLILLLYFLRKYSISDFEFVWPLWVFWLHVLSTCIFLFLESLGASPLSFFASQVAVSLQRSRCSLLICFLCLLFVVLFFFGTFHRVYSTATVSFWRKPFRATMSFRQSLVSGTLAVFWQRLLTLFYPGLVSSSQLPAESFLCS